MASPQIFTHTDFDGVVSAALASLGFSIDSFYFTSPNRIRANEVGEADVVCDLPHPARRLRAWFDHHAQNIEQARQMGWSVGDGAVREAPSAARVVFDHLKTRIHLPAFLADTVVAADRVDSMDYDSIEAWLAEDPENVINASIFLPGESLGRASRFLTDLVKKVRDYRLSEVAGDSEVLDRYRRTQELSARARETLERVGKTAAGGEICILDFSEMKVAPGFSKNLAYVAFPDVRAVLSIFSVMHQQRKTNDLKLSLSINPFFNQDDRRHNCAQIFQEMELGGGHPDAAGATISAFSKSERQQVKKIAVDRIVALWSSQKRTQDESIRK